MDIPGNLRLILQRIGGAAARSGRNPDIIKLVAVSKTFELRVILDAVNAGVEILGENRVQEARAKISEFRALNPLLRPEWHLVGTLQKNKVKYAVKLFDLIHSVDSADLAAEVNRQARLAGKVQRILVQVNLSGEAAKQGISEEGLMELLGIVSCMDCIKLQGLMTIPPFSEKPEESRPYFRRLNKLANRVTEAGYPADELSMGMTNDFEVAVEEGATMVRIGTAIFGRRQRG
jgi:pyridoxal phosphate enzyme (YggS family)